ncbi:MAG: signal recognition particle-docking protein FtsY [Lentisphaeria bacterium]|nr:signal recognition particle-docking protein FtsY [Lentisphaeria bacterium]
MMSIFDAFKRGLKKTAVAIGRKITGIFTEVKKWDEESFRRLENELLAADFGVAAARRITHSIKDRYQQGEFSGDQDILAVAREELCRILKEGARELHTAENGPTVILMVGVNGSGKTTTAGKLAAMFTAQGRKVMLAACDTFRAAAVEQLKLWGERTGCPVVASKPGADAAAVAFDAVASARAKNMDFLIIDTAGRQQNQKGLMDELAKILRIIRKQLPDAPHETLLTLDAGIGTNALSQAREFAAVSGASALVLTKLDGTGKGGAAAAVQEEFHLPILFTGLGEAPEDLQAFSPEMYAEAIFPSPDKETE